MRCLIEDSAHRFIKDMAFYIVARLKQEYRFRRI